MSAGGPKPSFSYIERQGTTRTLNGIGGLTPAIPTNLNSSNTSFQLDPGIGNPTPGDGLVFSQSMTISVSIIPNPGATLSGAGTLQCWLWKPYIGNNNVLGFWSRSDDLDIDLSAASGFPAKSAQFQNISRLGGFINWLTSGVTVSSGTDVLIRLDGFTSVGSQAI